MHCSIGHILSFSFRPLLWILVLAYATPGKTQHPYFYNLNNETGLPSNEVYQVAQDSFGFIWIGCDAGLFRYNGLNYVAYTNPRQNSKSISNITIDNHQNVWCQNFTGQIFKVAPGSDTLSIVYYDNPYSRAFAAFTIDTSGRLWVASDSILVAVSSAGKILKKITPRSLSITSNGWRDITCSRDNKIYASTFDGSYAIIDANTYASSNHNCPVPGATNALITVNNSILEYIESLSPRKYHVVDVTNGANIPLAEFVPLGKSAQNFTISGRGNDLVLCTSAGAVLLNERATPKPGNPILFPKQKISNFFVDRENNFWFTSLQEGIFIIPSPDVQVYNRSNSLLKDENISTIEQRGSDELIVGTYSGELYQLNTSEQTLKLTSGNEENKYKAVKKIRIANGKVYVARGPFTIIEHGKTSVISQLNNTRDFTVVNDTIYYTSSNTTGYIVNRNGNWEQKILRDKGGKKVLYDNKHHQVYFGCIDGLYRYINNELSEVRDGKDAIFASYLLYDNDSLWAGTTNAGVLVLKENKIVRRSASKNLLADNNVKALYKKGNILYAATSNGINIIDLPGNTSILLNEYDGLAYKEVNELAILGGKLYIATIKGLVNIPEEAPAVNKVPPNISITAVHKNDRLIDITKPINFNYGDNNLTIEFISAAFRSRGAFQYKYRLKGFDDEWRYTNSNSPRVNFSTLPAGDFTFEVYAVNEDGVSSLHPAVLSVVSNAPVWRQWWFYLMIFCIALSAVLLIFKLRLNYIQRKAEERNKLVASQLTALKAQMNPHFMYNALNSIQAFIINNDVKNSNLYLNKFSKLMRKVLDASDLETIPLQDEIDIMELYLELEKFRFGSDFNYNISIAEHIDTYNTYLPSMILQPFIENAIKHGFAAQKGPKHLEISFSGENELCCTIRDNGIGRVRSEEIKQRSKDYHKPFGTRATEKRIELLNSYMNNKYSVETIDLYDDTEPAGTMVMIHIPL